jgi:hypothetical protein
MQEEAHKSLPVYSEEEFSFKQLIDKRRDDLKYLYKLRTKIVIGLLVGGIIGALIAWIKPITYTARLTFVVEDTKASGGGLISALAGQFGFDMGAMANSGSVLAGDNVQELLKSQKIIKQTLLTPFAKNPKYTLADRYADTYKLKKKWKNSSKIGRIISFPPDKKDYTRLQDSLLHVIIKSIVEEELSVVKTDKKLSFFEINTTLRDEKLAQLLCSRLIDEATEFYINTKTSRLRANVARLQRRADSLTYMLNRKTYSASQANQILLDLNPAYSVANAGIEVRERDKMVSATIYSEVVKNLEVSKTMLIQETPTFQIVDEPELPLKKNRLKYSVAIVLGGIVGSFLYAVFLLFLKK